MAKKEKKRKESVDISVYDNNIERDNIADACMSYMKIFGANNNLMRHLPEVFDGLKISERRILYTMYIMGLNYNKPRSKVKDIVGRTMGFHPHGDIAIEETLVKMAQPWSNIKEYIDRKGNFGSPAGDPPASGRYIEARLSYYAYKCFFEEMSPDITDMRDNYLRNAEEPEVLPAKYPNSLISNVFGIGYGVGTSIPTYNFREVCETTINLINNPDFDDIVLYPDSPTGAYIVDEGQFEAISKDGTGRFKMRGVIEVNHELNALEIRSTPILTSWLKLKRPIIKMFASKEKSSHIQDIIDLSDIGTFHYRIIFKKEIDPVVAMNDIYARTDMEKTFGVRFKMTEEYVDTDYNIKSLLQTWIDFRRETKRRIYNHNYMVAKERHHLLETLIVILNKDNAENTVKIIKNSTNNREASKSLMKTYGISSLQADFIANLKLGALNKESREKYKKEREELEVKIAELEKIILNPKRIDKIIIGELEEGIKLFGADRKSKIITLDNTIRVRDTEHVIVFTLNGLVKKLPGDVKSIGELANGDFPSEIIKCRNTSDLLIFDEKGKIFRVPVSDIPASILSDNGIKISSLCNISGKLASVKIKPIKGVTDKIKSTGYFCMVTKNGLIKKTNIESYITTRTELNGIVIKDDDALVSCKMLMSDSDIVVYTNKGNGIRFNSSEIKDTGRMSVGVRAMTLSTGEEIIGFDILNKRDKFLFIVTSKGYVKKCSLTTFDTMSRNSEPLKLAALEPGDTVSVVRTIRGDEVMNVYMKSGFESIDVSIEVPELPRMSKGKKMISVRKGDTIINVSPSGIK